MPKVKVWINRGAKVVRTIANGRLQIKIRDDGSFLVVHPFSAAEADERFAIGFANGMSDDEICRKAAEIFSAASTRFFHQDGTLDRLSELLEATQTK